MSTDEKIMIARNVIENLNIEDEDLKQEIYLRALQFDVNLRIGCTGCKNQNICLLGDLTKFIKEYQANKKMIQDLEVPVRVSLTEIDSYILSLLFGRM